MMEGQKTVLQEQQEKKDVEAAEAMNVSQKLFEAYESRQDVDFDLVRYTQVSVLIRAVQWFIDLVNSDREGQNLTLPEEEKNGPFGPFEDEQFIGRCCGAFTQPYVNLMQWIFLARRTDDFGLRRLMKHIEKAYVTGTYSLRDKLGLNRTCGWFHEISTCVLHIKKQHPQPAIPYRGYPADFIEHVGDLCVGGSSSDAKLYPRKGRWSVDAFKAPGLMSDEALDSKPWGVHRRRERERLEIVPESFPGHRYNALDLEQTPRFEWLLQLLRGLQAYGVHREMYERRRRTATRYRHDLQDAENALEQGTSVMNERDTREMKYSLKLDREAQGHFIGPCRPELPDFYAAYDKNAVLPVGLQREDLVSLEGGQFHGLSAEALSKRLDASILIRRGGFARLADFGPLVEHYMIETFGRYRVVAKETEFRDACGTPVTVEDPEKPPEGVTPYVIAELQYGEVIELPQADYFEQMRFAMKPQISDDNRHLHNSAFQWTAPGMRVMLGPEDV
jgi:hypothetical protein